MAQLIKLQDYITRYESDLSRYPTQFVRLKKQQWEKWKHVWEENQFLSVNEINQSDSIVKDRFIDKVKKWFNKEEIIIETYDIKDTVEDEMDGVIPYHVKTELELKQQFLDQLLKFQMKWASSTISQNSIVDAHYYQDEKLKHFLQRFPDSFLLLYEPILLLKKAPIDFEVLLITPTDIWCLAFLEAEENAAFIGATDHFWLKRLHEKEEKVLNPTLSVFRMEKIVRQLFHEADVDLPVKKAVVSRNGYIDYPNAPSELTLLDKRSYGNWFNKMRNHQSPMKSMQMKAAKILLDYCMTSSYRRPDWSKQHE